MNKTDEKATKDYIEGFFAGEKEQQQKIKELEEDLDKTTKDLINEGNENISLTEANKSLFKQIRAKDDEIKKLKNDLILYDEIYLDNEDMEEQIKALKKKIEEIFKEIIKLEGKRITDNNDNISIPLEDWIKFKKIL